MSKRTLVIYVDVDDTLIRTLGTKRVPIPTAISHVRALHTQGAVLYCWSSGGEQYARESARAMGIEECFVGFLPKPQILIDDQEVSEWRYCRTVHPSNCGETSMEDYVTQLYGDDNR